MIKAQRIYEYGGPEMFQWEDFDPGPPGPGEVRLKHEAIGVNYIDIYMRSGLYPVDELPFVPGREGAGIVVETGEGVTELQPDDRVAYAGPPGSYAEERNIAAERLVKLPGGIDFDIAASVMLQGMTARYLLKETYPVGPDTVLLIHGAAGGLGLLLTQWAVHLGAEVIGTAGSDEKTALALANGCAHAINYRTQDFVEAVAGITNGNGVDVVYDPIGKDTFPGSLICLRRRGMWVSFGQASGAIPPFDMGVLSQKKSLFVTRPSLFDYTDTREELVETANDLFAMLTAGHLKASPNHRYDLSQAAQAHRDLEARKTTGSIILLP